MRKAKTITRLLLLMAAMVVASCTPEETVVPNDLMNTSWIFSQTYERMDNDGNPYAVHETSTIHFETHNSGRMVSRDETPFEIEDDVIPITYTYNNESHQGTITLHNEDENITIPMTCNTENNILSFAGTDFYKISK